MWRLTIKLDYDEEQGSAGAERLVEAIRHWEHDCPADTDDKGCWAPGVECQSIQKAVGYDGEVLWRIDPRGVHDQQLTIRSEILDGLDDVISRALATTLLSSLRLEEEKSFQRGEFYEVRANQ